VRDGKLWNQHGSAFFLSGGKIFPLRQAKQVRLIASREYGLY